MEVEKWGEGMEEGQQLGKNIAYYNIAYALSLLVIAVASPALGVISDRAGRRKPFLAVVTLIAFALSGCGIRGSLEKPAASQTTTDTTASADSGQGKPENAAPKPHKGFVLDGLIR